MIFLIGVMVTMGCNDPEGDIHWQSINEMLVDEDGQILIVGTKNGVGINKHIKSPYLMLLDEDFKTISKRIYRTETTALNPKIISSANGSKILSYYSAQSLANPTESSHVLFLNQNFKLRKDTEYGNRTRVRSLLLDNDMLWSLNYERISRKTSLKSFNNSKQISEHIFSASEESSLPTDMVKSSDSKLLAGIAQGFHYRDGHDYDFPRTHGFVIKVNMDGSETHRTELRGEHHLFLNDLLLRENGVVATGTEQSNKTGMDVLLVELDKELKIVNRYAYKKQGIQEGIKSRDHEGIILTLATSEDLIDHTLKVYLIKSDGGGNIIWEKELGGLGSYKPKDLLVYNNRIVVAANFKAHRNSNQEAILITVDLDGTDYREIRLKL